MKEIQDKKISTSLILFSVLGFLISLLIKEPYDYNSLVYYEEKKISYPLSEYDVHFLFIKFDLKTILVFFTILFGFGIYLFLFKTDDETRTLFKTKSILTVASLKRTALRFKEYLSKIQSKKANQVEQSSGINPKNSNSRKKTKKPLLFFIKYITPIILIVVVVSIYLNLSLSPIEKLELDINISEKIITQSGVILENNVDYTKIFRESLIKSNLFYEIQEYRNLKYVTELLNLCGTTSLNANDRKILKDCSLLQGLLEFPHLNTQYKTYKNFAHFTAIAILIIIFIVLFKFRKNRFAKLIMYIFYLYCFLHFSMITSNNQTQKIIDKELKLRFKSGCWN